MFFPQHDAPRHQEKRHEHLDPGTGTMASGLAVLFSKAGHDVTAASDAAAARQSVSALATSAGLNPAEAGGLAAARCLEPVAALNIAFGYGLGHGTDIAPTWQGIA